MVVRGARRDEISERAEVRLTELENLSRDAHTSLSPVSQGVCEMRSQRGLR